MSEPTLSTASVVFRIIEIYFLLVILSPILRLDAKTIQCISVLCLVSLLFINGHLSKITSNSVILRAIQSLVVLMYVTLLFRQDLQEHLEIWFSLILLFFIMRMCEFFGKVHQGVVEEFTSA
jgi:hypothetical protein